MAHPELDQAFGRLAASRLGAGPAGEARPVTAEPCADAETWAAYVDGGLAPDEVTRLDEHLATCVSCRRLVAALGGDGGAAESAVPAAATERRGVLLPFRPRATWAWLSMAATLLGALTLWSIARLDRGASLDTQTAADRTASAPIAAEPPPPAAQSAAPPAAAAPMSRGAKPVAAKPTDDGRTRLARSTDEVAEAPRPLPAPSPSAPPAQPAPPGRPPDQINAAPGGRAGFRGPAVNQAQNQQAQNQQAQNQAARTLQATERERGQAQEAKASKAARAPAPTVPAAPPPPAAVAAPPPQIAQAAPATAPPPAPTTPARDEETRAGNERAAGQGALADATKADALKAEGAKTPAEIAKEADAKRTADAAAALGGLSETVTTTGTASGRQRAAARRKDAPAGATLGFGGGELRAAVATFAEPEGRLRWRIAADGRHIESSSDGGASWTERYASRSARLRAGSAPSIDVAWAVGERGLVLRRAVPGDWAAVATPVAATLTAVTATSADAARVTTDDGRVFVTTDGGRTWAPATAGPP